ncbi:MAG: FliM/FliN family flagellar motor C-terminal domain-containing protein [Tabrizicola sp.]
MSDVIRRKIDRSRQPQADGAPGADRGWRLALARAARDAMGLDLEFRRLTVSRASLAEILEIAPERALIALLDGPRGGLGVLMLDPAVTAAFIEMQTLGRLQVQPTPPRKPTRVDAAMVAGVIDRALLGLDETLAEEADRIWAGGFRYASHLEDVRPLGLLLEEEAYRVLKAEVALGPAARPGEVILVLPALGRGERPAHVAEVDDTSAPQFTATLAAQVLQAGSCLDAVIGRLTLPIRQILDLKAGDVLAMPLSTLDGVALETLDGQSIARARLGQNRGMRAVKLLSAEPSATPHLPAAKTVAQAGPGPAEEWREAG